jgi:hypothetical protein
VQTPYINWKALFKGERLSVNQLEEAISALQDLTGNGNQFKTDYNRDEL